MRFNSPYWRAIRRCLFIFVAISLLPLALVYMVRLDQAYRLKGYEYVNESHLPVLPEDAVHTLAPIDVERVEKRMERRRKLLQEKCTEFGLDVVGNDTWHKPNAWEFLVNKKYHIIWCNVFKAGSSSWMYNFNVLAGYSPEFLQRTKEVFLTLARERYPRLSVEKLREAQNDSITFMIARHPFERLLSAYRDKMVFAIPHSYHDKLGRRIVRKYRSKI
uniref:Carbohydrate sulfotransferase n=1 Tax=Bactrocera latifrons TaxID=174628 RepID=A0A0K8V7W4_BACLA